MIDRMVKLWFAHLVKYAGWETFSVVRGPYAHKRRRIKLRTPNRPGGK